MSSFAATNIPGTCLWCGEKLRQVYNTTWKHTDKKPRGCGGIINNGTWEQKRCGGKTFRRNLAGNWECLDCHWETQGRKQVETRVPAYDKLGSCGDGFFCNKKHSRFFALVAARNGYRLPNRLPPHQIVKKTKGMGAVVKLIQPSSK